MDKTEQASKAGKASALARQSPQLVADKAKAIALHQAGKDTGAISQALPGRQRTEIRRWLIAAGIYRTLGSGKAVAGRKRYDPVKLIVKGYASELKQAAKMDTERHWRKHPATRKSYAANAKQFYYDNRQSILATLRARYKTETLHKRLRRLLATRISHAIKRHDKPTRKAAKTMDLIGCTIAELRLHIERQFTVGMAWINYGRNGWHIDHKRPCNSFDLTDDAQQRTCFHFTNLQPLWEAENISKSDRWL